MKCINNVSYSTLINGQPRCPFPAKKGLRQGDPLSPFLFVLAMKFFTRLLKGLKEIKEFHYHPRCAKLNIIQLGFANNLLLFSRGDVESAKKLFDYF